MAKMIIDGYEVDTNRKFEDYKKGDLICFVAPFFGIPLTLEFSVRANGTIAFRKWDWNRKESNSYLHTDENPETFIATEQQIDTVSGLFSGRIKFDGLKIAVGGTVQDICPVDVKKEEKLIGKKIYLN